MDQPAVNEFQRCLVAARNNQSSVRNEKPPTKVRNFHFKGDKPPLSQTPLVEWAVSKRHNEKYVPIIQKSGDGLATYYSEAPGLDWEWFQVRQKNWANCPQCGRMWPKTARYWWWRDRNKGYLWLNACRDCKCKSKKRVADKYRIN